MGCGCVFSDRALKEIKDSICSNCGRTYVDDDIIVINGSDEEMAELQARLEQRRLAAKASRKRKGTPSAAAAAATEVAASSVAQSSVTNGSSDAARGTAAASDAGTSVTSTCTGKVLKTGSGDKKPKTIQDDPRATEVFKSLFNTHKTAKQQQQAHWVTYNPQYF